MGHLHATIDVTLDGCCEHTQVIADDEFHEWVTALFSGAAALLFGRTTFELLRGHWPAIAANGEGSASVVAFARLLESKPKYVISREELAPGWNASRLSFGHDGAGVAALKRDLPGMLLLVASPSLARALVQARLVEEYHLAIQPIFVRHGPTFLSGLSSAPARLRLADTNRLRSGVTVHRYALETMSA